MTRQTYKQCPLIMILIGPCLVPVLYAQSDHRPQTVEEVTCESKVHLSKDAKRSKEMCKEPNSHEDGEAGILLSARAGKIKLIGGQLSSCEVDENSREFVTLEDCLTALSRRGSLPGLNRISWAHSKQATSYRYGNFIGLLIDEKTDKISCVRWDS